MTDLPHPPRTGPATVLPAAILGAWLAAATALAAGGAFAQDGPGLPLRILPFILLPPLLFLAAYRLLPGLRAWVAGLDLALVVGLQAWRVIGLVFLAFWVAGGLPAAFALPAAIGDVAVAALAVGAALAVARRDPGWEARARALVGWGLLDFVAAVSLALLASEGMPLRLPGAPTPDALLTLPLALIPAFAVPAFIILHAIAWLRIAEGRRAAGLAERAALD